MNPEHKRHIEHGQCVVSLKRSTHNLSALRDSSVSHMSEGKSGEIILDYWNKKLRIPGFTKVVIPVVI